jgi:hypothetical protein
MTQRQILENSINLMNQLQGPAKILTAPGTLPMPILLAQVIDPTGGGAATGWTSLGLTAGGVNVTKTITKQVNNDVDQIIGSYGQQTTDRAYNISTQLAEVLDRTQTQWALEEAAASQVSTAGATQMLIPLDSGSNSGERRRVAVVYPKGDAGKALAFIFRQVEVAGGDKTWRFDKTDKARPALDLVAFPEIATTIDQNQEYGYRLDII